MEPIILRNPQGFYRRRFNRFLLLLVSVRGLKPKDRHLWQVMDGVAFQNTETALEVALHNQGRTLGMDEAEQLTLAVMDAHRCSRRRRKTLPALSD